MDKSWFEKIALLIISFAIVAEPSIILAQTNQESLSTQTQNAATRLQITNISHNINSHVLTVGETLTVTIKGTEGANTSVLLIGDKQKVREYQARETSPGVYIANIILTQGDRFIEGAMMARLQKGTQVFYSAASEAFTVNSATNNQNTSFVPSNNTTTSTTVTNTQNISLPLNITSHHNGDLITNNGVTIQGQTEPNAEIQIKITSSTAIVGNLIQIEGDTLIDQIVNADSKGKFVITIPPNSQIKKGLQYQISAIAFKNHAQSRPVQLTLIQK